MEKKRKISLEVVVAIIGIAIIATWFTLTMYFFIGSLKANKDSKDDVCTETQITPHNCLEILLMVQNIGKEEVNENNALNLIDMLGIEHPKIVLAQMRLESGNFSSNLAKEHNNFFGMGHPRVRANVSCGANKSGYATYKHWGYSILDYGLWQKSQASGLSEEEYLAFLAKRYAEDDKYVEKVLSIAKKIN